MNQIFAAVYARLSAQIADVPVYDHIPEGTDEYPYIQMSITSLDNNDTDSEKGFEANLRVLAFTRYRGVQELNTLIDRIYGALHQWEMPDTTNYSVGFLIEQVRRTNTSPDGLTRYGVQEYKLWVDEI
jgi:hypothetical protein